MGQESHEGKERRKSDRRKEEEERALQTCEKSRKRERMRQRELI